MSNIQVHVVDTSITRSKMTSDAGDDIFTSAVLIFIYKIIRFYSPFFKGQMFPLKMCLHLQAYSSVPVIYLTFKKEQSGIFFAILMLVHHH